ncbi:cyclic nucleotide-binding domain-containing protein [Haliangium sp.]|uniref:cyclic nucleotide-binding domain-containing protein n=1 Tax=Haliangium sp. TaxID=2663208 RepID=UPI003D0BEF30
MKYHSSGSTHPGRVRDRNEDYLLVDEDIGLYLVCDGMGGHNAGEVASEMAAKAIAEHLREQVELLREYSRDPKPRTRRKIKGTLDKAVQKACQSVWRAASRDRGMAGMGTTLAMVLVCGRNAFVLHVGDSRVYLLRNRTLCQLTEDHTLMADMIKEGMMSREAAKKHPHAAALTRAVGIQSAVQADILHVEMMLGDRYLLCSDGVTAYLDGQDLLRAIQRPGLDGLAEHIVAEANARGGRDNVTALILGVEHEGQEPTIEHSEIVAKKIEVLLRIPMFSSFDYKELVKFLELGELRTARKGEAVIREGEEDATMYVILTGRAEVFKGDHLVNRLGPGDYFGEMSLIDQVPRSATVVAIQPMTFMVLERERFFKLLQSDARIATKVFWAFVQKLNRRLRQADDEVYRLGRALAERDG